MNNKLLTVRNINIVLFLCVVITYIGLYKLNVNDPEAVSNAPTSSQLSITASNFEDEEITTHNTSLNQSPLTSQPESINDNDDVNINKFKLGQDDTQGIDVLLEANEDSFFDQDVNTKNIVGTTKAVSMQEIRLNQLKKQLTQAEAIYERNPTDFQADTINSLSNQIEMIENNEE